MRGFMKVVMAYALVSVVLLSSGFVFPAENEYLSSGPIALSLILLIPLYIGFRRLSRENTCSQQINGREKRAIVIWILIMFLLAMTVRTASVLWFQMPYEKTATIYLVILTILLVEKTHVSAFGFSTRNLLRMSFIGLAFFAVFTVSHHLVLISWAYGLGGQLNFGHFDLLGFLSVLPFMVFCVGISEEGLFRGYMQNHLERLSSGKKAIVLQAAFFGVWHVVWDIAPFNPFDMLLYVVSTFVVGLLFGYAYSKVRNLVPLVLAHGLGNSFQRGVAPIYMGLEEMVEGVAPGLLLVVMISPYIVSILLTFVFTKNLDR